MKRNRKILRKFKQHHRRIKRIAISHAIFMDKKAAQVLMAYEENEYHD